MDHVAAESCHEPSHGRASLQKRPMSLWWKQWQSSECCKLIEVETQQGQKSKSGLLFSMPLLWGFHKARCDFLNTANEKRLDFHRPADLLRAGVSQIKFQIFFVFPVHFPADDTAAWSKFLSGIKKKQEFSWISSFFTSFFERPVVSYVDFTWRLASIT